MRDNDKRLASLAVCFCSWLTVRHAESVMACGDGDEGGDIGDDGDGP